MRFATVGCLALLVGCKSPVVLAPGVLEGPDVLDFGEVPVGEIVSTTLTLTNTGQASVDVLSLSLVEGDRDVWSYNGVGQSVDGGGSLSFDVTFEPEDPGALEGGVLQLRTNSSVAPGVLVRLLGVSALSEADDDGDGFSIADGDCDDSNNLVFPGAEERCDGLDNDCDGDPDDDEADSDGDGVRICDGDCADDDATIYTGAPELCDGLDNDCDLVVSDDSDLDGDGQTTCQEDCNDLDARVASGLQEQCGDGLDNDCDGVVDSVDADSDGHDACGVAPDCDDTDATVFPRVVDVTGDDAAVGSDALPLATIQAAFDSLNPGCSSIYLMPGDYHGGVGSGGATVVGLGASPADTRLSGPGPVLDLTGGVWALRNLTIADGIAMDRGGGIRVQADRLALRQVDVVDNQAMTGGGLSATGTTVSLAEGVRFERNTAADGAGLFLSGGFLLDNGGTLYADNIATGAGGGAYVDGAMTQSDAEFIGNQAFTGGGVVFAGGAGQRSIRGRFEGNIADVGGAIANLGADSVRLTNHLLLANTAVAEGGGVALTGGSTVLANSTFVANTATSGAAVHVAVDEAELLGCIAHFNDGDGAFATTAMPSSSHNTVFGTAGADVVGSFIVQADDRVENPGFVQFSDDDDFSNDDFSLQPISPSRDSGPEGEAFLDLDGSRNDRGHTGGPGAQ